jgi:hypothetical protein
MFSCSHRSLAEYTAHVNSNSFRCQNAIPITWLLRGTPITFGSSRLCRTHCGVKGPRRSLLGHPGCAELIAASKGSVDQFWVVPAVPNSLWRQRANPTTFGAPRLCHTHFGVKGPGQSLLGRPGCAILILALKGRVYKFWVVPAMPNALRHRRARPITFGAPRLCNTHFGVKRPG